MKQIALVLLIALACVACAADANELQEVVIQTDPIPPKNPQQSEAPPRVSKKERLSPQAIEVRLKDGSALRGELKNTEPITLKTSFGTLKFPMQELVQICHGAGTMPLDEKQFAAALSDFKSSDADKRVAAERVFLNAGKSSLDSLFSLRSSASVELKPRVDDLLKRIYVESENDTEARDTVRATQLEASGTLDIQMFKLSSKVGEIALKLTDIESIRWIAHGDIQNLNLDALTAAREWTDTGIDALLGEPMAVASSGTMTLFNAQVNPSGTSNQDNEPFPFGAVIGKFGLDGEPFLIGSEKTWKPDSNQRLFVRVYASDEVLQNNNGRCRGQFSVRVACGPRVKEALMPASGE